MNELSLEDLCEAIYEDLNAHVLSVTSDGLCYHVDFECEDWRGSSGKRHFRMTFSDIAEATVTPRWFGSIAVECDHPLLWKHHEQHLSMYFSSAPATPIELIGELYERHRDLVSGWRELSETLHADSSLLRHGYGLFAEGPRRVIEEFARVVGYRLRYSIVPGRVPAGGYRVALFDAGYIVYREATVLEIVVE